MAPDDSRVAFLQIPWTAALLKRPNIVCRVPNSRGYKESTEDSLFAEILKTPRTIRSCLIVYQRPPPGQERIEEVHVLCDLGNGLNGHPETLHGGIIATLLDEAMGFLPASNHEWQQMNAVAQGKADGELPPQPNASYTADFKIRYLKPVMTPGALIITARYIQVEGRKIWIAAEVKQRGSGDEGNDGDGVVCATGEALFIEPKQKKSRL